MVTRISSLTFYGLEIIDVDVQIQLSPGVPNFTIVGLADKTIAESRERVRAALSSIGLAMPAKKILVNLAPADLVKEGSHFDLAIALGVLTSMGAISEDQIKDYMIVGELSLDGNILPIHGVLPAAIGANSRKKGFICSKSNAKEAVWSGNKSILAAGNIIEIVNHFKGTQVLSQPEATILDSLHKYPDLKDVKGQHFAKRALEIAAAGGHNMLMVGPPGSGKSMLAQRLLGIMPKLTPEEILECSTVASIAGKLVDGELTLQRPYRDPHHSCSIAAMVGGGIGKKIKPGEVSLAHNGILFLDELPEFNSGVIESLRQPMETGQILISRSGAQIRYPASFQVIAAMNPCKCGYLSDPSKACHKAPKCGSNYQSKISGPIIDRFDLHVEVGYESDFILHEDESKQEDSKTVAERVFYAREIQAKRYDGYNIKVNNRLDGKMLVDYAMPFEDGRDLLNQAVKKFRLSMRAYNRILRVARTIADLSGQEMVNKIHVAEALSYRQLEWGN